MKERKEKTYEEMARDIILVLQAYEEVRILVGEYLWEARPVRAVREY